MVRSRKGLPTIPRKRSARTDPRKHNFTDGIRRSSAKMAYYGKPTFKVTRKGKDVVAEREKPAPGVEFFKQKLGDLQAFVKFDKLKNKAEKIVREKQALKNDPRTLLS